MIYTWLGIAASVMVVIAYYALIEGKWSANSKQYLYCNLISLIMMIISLTHDFNVGAMIIQIFLLIVTIKGLIQRKPQ